MYDTCRENDNLSSIITPKNFVKVTRFKDISHNEMLHYFVLVEPYEKSQNLIYQCLMSIYWKLTKLIICLAQYLAYLINDLDKCVP